MGGTHGGCHPEFLWVFYDVGFCGGIDPTATGSVDVFFYILVKPCCGFLCHSQFGDRSPKLPSIKWDHCGNLKGRCFNLFIRHSLLLLLAFHCLAF